MSSLDIKKIKNTLDNLYLEKQKIEKGEKPKKSKGKGKAKLKMEGDNVSFLNYLPSYCNDCKHMVWGTILGVHPKILGSISNMHIM